MLAMRKTILSIIPEAEEVVSYGMPAFKVNGKVVAGILHAKNHVGYYPFSGSIVKLFSQELKNYSTTKSAIHVPVDKPFLNVQSRPEKWMFRSIRSWINIGNQ
jgi:uncharacterized protein YdhG (YjbR/CyaY superfamily)